MVKLIFLADTHLGFDFPLRPKKEKRRRGDDFFRNFDQVLAYAQSKNADLVIHGGDLFYRTLVPPPIVDMVYERIFNFADSGIPIVIVPGNHESSRLPVSLFMQHPNIHFYTEAQVFRFALKGMDLDVAGFPCVRKDVESTFSDLANKLQVLLRDEAFKLLCMHQSIEGAQVGPSDYTFRQGKDVIQIKDLPHSYDLILSGHIHRSQILRTVKHTPILYPGSIERTSFAEKDEAKGFYEIDIDENHNCTYTFIELDTRPMMDVLLEKERYTPASLKSEISEAIKNLPQDCIVRFKLKHTDNLHLMNVKLLDALVPPTMNYQVAGFRELYSQKH